MSSSFTLSHKLLAIIVILGSGGVAYVKYNHDQKDVYAFHCDEINHDITRPPERMCVQPLSIEDSTFTFRTENNRVEVYTIIPMSGDINRIGDGEEFKYNFVHYLNGD